MIAENGEEIPQILVFRYAEVDGVIYPRDDSLGDMPLIFKKSEKDPDTYVASIGMAGVAGIYFHEKYGSVVFYSNGYCQTEESFAEFLGNDLPTFYEWVSEDSVLISSIVGVGILFRVENGVYLHEDYSALMKQENLEIFECSISQYNLTLYVNSETGKGYAMLAENGHEGEDACITTVSRAADGVYRIPFMLVMDIVVEVSDSGSVTANLATPSNM
jgi:hypothetical protein